MEVDAVVIGAGINGLVASAELARAGWSVALVDSRDRLGGFIASDELTVPGQVHDTFSSWHPLFVAGDAYAALGEALHDHGLEYANTDGRVTASVSDRGIVVAHRDPQKTVEGFAVAADRDAYLSMLGDLDRHAPTVFGVLGSELRPSALPRLGLRAGRSLGAAGVQELARTALQSGRAYARERFTGWEADQLWSPWLLHAGLSPDHASGGLMLPVMAGTMHGIGLPVVRGGAGRFVDAFSAVLAEAGVETVLGAPAERVEVVDGRAVAVRVGGQRIAARRAVIATTSTAALYDDLLVVPPGTGVAAARRHRPGRAAMQLHVALDRPLRWSDDRLDDVPLVHVSDGSDSTGVACAQAEAGLLPSAPTVVVGQQAALDPSRVPDGAGQLWVQLQELPFAPRGDAGGTIAADGTWGRSTVDAYVDRVLERIAAHAPDLKSSVVAVTALSPHHLTQENANAVAGDPYGGAAELDQSLLWRPGTTRGHRTGVAGLWHAGAFTHPGPGLGGGSGHLVAQHLITSRRGPARLLERLRR